MPEVKAEDKALSRAGVIVKVYKTKCILVDSNIVAIKSIDLDKGLEFLEKNVLQGLPSVEERFKVNKIPRKGVDVDGESWFQLVEYKGLVCGSSMKDRFELELIFLNKSKEELIVKWSHFSGKTIIPKKVGETNRTSNSDGTNLNSPEGIGKEADEEESSIEGIVGDKPRVEGTINRETMAGGLTTLINSLDNQRWRVIDTIGLFGGDVTNWCN
ncbi:hypothetical protein SCA6_000849 [Theobroma cacao]